MVGNAVEKDDVCSYRERLNYLVHTTWNFDDCIPRTTVTIICSACGEDKDSKKLCTQPPQQQQQIQQQPQPQIIPVRLIDNQVESLQYTGMLDLLQSFS